MGFARKVVDDIVPTGGADKKGAGEEPKKDKKRDCSQHCAMLSAWDEEITRLKSAWDNEITRLKTAWDDVPFHTNSFSSSCS